MSHLACHASVRGKTFARAASCGASRSSVMGRVIRESMLLSRLTRGNDTSYLLGLGTSAHTARTLKHPRTRVNGGHSSSFGAMCHEAARSQRRRRESGRIEQETKNAAAIGENLGSGVVATLDTRLLR